MSLKIVPISWQKFEKFLLIVGCVFKRQRGSHRIYDREGLTRSVVVPAREVPIFVIRNNLRILNITIEEYLNILKRL